MCKLCFISTHKAFWRFIALMIIRIIMSSYKNNKSIIIVAYYKGRKVIIMRLIKMKIRFICFYKDEGGRSCV